MAYLDDQNGRPVPQKFLDLLPLKPQLEDEVKTALHKLAEVKLRPEKIPEEEDVVKPLSCKIKEFPYLDPVPSSMLHVDIREFSAVEIDWKMLTLDRPETQLDINIFSRMVYLDKLMAKCIVEERVKKEREKFIRLRTKGRFKPPTDSDGDKSDEFTYEYFSRFFGSNNQAQAMEEVPKPAPEEPKHQPPVPAENQQTDKSQFPQSKRKTKRPKRKPKRKKKKKKKSKKTKLRKRRLAQKPKSKVDQRMQKFRSLVASSKNKLKKRKAVEVPRKKALTSGTGTKKKTDSNKTLIQMLKASEQQEKKKTKPSET